jgi:hypothetical protein
MSRLQTAFEKFHGDNPAIYEHFCKFTQEVLDAGYPVVPAAMLLHRIRWESMIAVDTDQPYKLNQNFATYYARKYMVDHPHLGEVFKTRVLRAE